MQNQYEQMTRIDGLDQQEAEARLGLLADFNQSQGFSQIPLLRELGIPMLYLFGEKDRGKPLRANQVAVENLIAEGVNLRIITYPDGSICFEKWTCGVI